MCRAPGTKDLSPKKLHKPTGLKLPLAGLHRADLEVSSFSVDLHLLLELLQIRRRPGDASRLGVTEQ